MWVTSPTGPCDHCLYTEVQVGCHNLPVQTETPIKSVSGYHKPQQGAGQWYLPSEEGSLLHQERCCIQGLGVSGSIHVSLTHHVPLHLSTENSWDWKVPPALEEHSQDKISLLSSTGFGSFWLPTPSQLKPYIFGEVSRELQKVQMKNGSRKKQPPGER